MHLRDQGLPVRIIHLAAETNAHSDDEMAPAPDASGPADTPAAGAQAGASSSNSEVYYIKTKEGRSEKVKNLF